MRIVIALLYERSEFFWRFGAALLIFNEWNHNNDNRQNNQQRIGFSSVIRGQCTVLSKECGECALAWCRGVKDKDCWILILYFIREWSVWGLWINRVNGKWMNGKWIIVSHVSKGTKHSLSALNCATGDKPSLQPP